MNIKKEYIASILLYVLVTLYIIFIGNTTMTVILILGLLMYHLIQHTALERNFSFDKETSLSNIQNRLEKTKNEQKEISKQFLSLTTSFGSGLLLIDEDGIITQSNKEVVDYFKDYAERLNCNLRQGTDSITTRHSLHYGFSGKVIDNNKRTPNTFLKILQKYNLIQNKHIPHDYKCNERQVQLELLAGIIDSDGFYDEKGFDIIQKNEQLLDDIIFIARSLGFAAYKSTCKKSLADLAAQGKLHSCVPSCVKFCGPFQVSPPSVE